MRLTTVLRDSNGTVLEGRAVTWSSTNPGIVTVDQEGLVTAVARGSASIVASSEGRTGNATVSVNLRFQTVSAAGYVHSCGLTTAGTIYCWGGNFSGQLGNGRKQGSNVPVEVVTGAVRFTSVVVYYQTSCAIAIDGTPYCWGLNNTGQLGLGDNSEHLTPVALSGGLHLRSIGLGELHGCGLDAGGVAWCWGNNDAGQLGTPFTGAPIRGPAPIDSQLRFDSLSVGGFSACGITHDGHTYCWGSGSYGELAGSNISPGSAVPVSGDPTFKSIFVGYGHACGVTPAGAGYCWGYNQDGSLGTGDSVSTAVPTPIAGGIEWQSIGGYCGLATSGSVYCWGDNYLFEFGIPSNTSSPVPVPGAIGATFSSVSTGTQFGCGMGADGFAYCWGNGVENGELGNGTNSYGMKAERVSYQ